MMRRTAIACAFAIAACHGKPSGLSAEDREAAMTAAKQCTDTIASLAPTYDMLGPKLAETLEMDRTEARRLLRDTVELLISTREMLCNISVVTVQRVLDKAPGDEQIAPARARVQAALDHLARARAAYDALLGAATSEQAPVDQAALLDRFSHALLAQ